MKLKVGSDFSGVGAFNQALNLLLLDYEEVFACDMDKFARQTFIHNYGEPAYYPTDVYERGIPAEPLDLYMTSPPCQAFSLAGKRLGKEDERGVLFFNSHEFIRVNRPRFFIFENVKGLISHDKRNKKDKIGETFKEWLALLGGKSVNGKPVDGPHEDAVPYHIYWKVLNAKNYGVPQNRERVFIVGIRDDQDNVFQWPTEMPLEKKLKDVLEHDVPEKYYLGQQRIDTIISKERHVGFTDPSIKETSYCVLTQYAKNQTDAEYLCIPVLTPDRINKRQNGRRFEEDGDPSFTITTQDRHGVYDGYRIRRLTPRECFRLMGFPDSFTWPVSDSQAYKQAGNSIVAPKLAAIIAELPLFKSI